MSLDIEQPEQLIGYLRESGRIDPDETPRVSVLAGGVSNRTVLVERTTSGGREAWVLKQALAKLRVKVDWFSDPARVHREAEGLRALTELVTPELPGAITPLVFEDERHHLLAMRAVPQPHENWKTMLLAGRLEMDHVEQFATLLATIHRKGHERRDEMAKRFDDRSFFESLRLEPYYLYTADQQRRSNQGYAKWLRDLVDQTRRRRFTIVHGDYSPKNVLIHRDRLVLLDHEVIHFGDPAFDVGFAMTHLLSKAHHLRDSRQLFAQAAWLFWNRYEQALGPVPWRSDLERFAFHHTAACLWARVRGRSQLEYLSEDEKRWQEFMVTDLFRKVPEKMPAFIERFIEDCKLGDH